MKLELSQQEYRLLLEMVYLGNWVIGADEPELPAEKLPYAKLEQKVFALAQEAGCADLVEYAPEHRTCFPTRRLEESSPAAQFLLDYENTNFGDQLSERLARRDVAEQAGGWDNFAKLSPAERFARISACADRYDAVFAEHGLDNLRLVDRG
jgi:hypothetical protein